VTDTARRTGTALLAVLLLAAAAGCTAGPARPPAGAAPMVVRVTSDNPVPNGLDLLFAKMMVAHHAQAVAMSRTLLAEPDIPERARNIAGFIEHDQHREIGEMNAWLQAWGRPTVDPADPAITRLHGPGAGHGMLTDGQLAEIVEGGTGRDAAFYFYDYRTDELVKQVVDVPTGKVTGSFRGKGMQLPASDREVATALDLLLAAPAGADVRALYTQVTGKPWTGKDQLQVEAHVYTARPADTEATSQCGRHRCVQLVARVDDGPFVDLNDIIIDLSGRTVARVK
jgi:hypothetical protein